MADKEPKKSLKEVLEEYTPEQREAPDPKYGTIEKRIEAVYDEDPKKAEKELQKEAEEQQKAVNQRAEEIQNS